MINERDLELQYHYDTGNTATTDDEVTSEYSRVFYDWCIEKLLLELNKNFENENIRVPEKFNLEENC